MSLKRTRPSVLTTHIRTVKRSAVPRNLLAPGFSSQVRANEPTKELDAKTTRTRMQRFFTAAPS